MIAGITAVAMVLGLVAFVAEVSNGALAGGYNLTAIASRSGLGLYPGSEVQVRGVNVGSVKGTRLLGDGQVAIKLHLDSGVRIPDSTTASIDPQSVFGPEDVNLSPGAQEQTGPFLPPGATIDHTTTSTDLLQVLQQIYPLLRAVDPSELSTVVQNISDALDGLGPDLGQTIDSLHVVAANARTEIPELEALLTQLARLTAALAPTGDQIVSIADNLDKVLPDINQPDQIAALLDNVSQVASDLSGVLEGHQPAINATINGLSTVAAGLSPRAAELPVLTQSLSSFFSLLSGIIHEPGETIPGGLLAGNIQPFLPTNPCVLFVGVCQGPS